MSSAPAISVVMSVYNAQRDVAKAAHSILSQSFSDFELIIVNDGSEDITGDILDELAAGDDRVHILHQDNTGLTRALNIGTAMAKGNYVARLDADDISYPDRLRIQFELLEANPDVSLVGGNADDIYPDLHQRNWGFYDEDVLQKIVYLKTPFPHSTVMMRRSVFETLGGYDESFQTSQDMELWMRFAKQGRIAMIEEPVIKRGIGPNAISARRRWRQFYDAFRARWRHNRGFGKVIAIYHALRSLLIALLPLRIRSVWHQKKD